MDRDEWLLLRDAGELPGGMKMLALVSGTPWSYSLEELEQMRGIRDKLSPGGQQDVADANALLDEVFGEGNRELEISCMAAGVEYVEDCLLFADMMKKNLGIKVVMESVEPAVGTERSNSGAYEMNSGAVAASTDFGDPDDYLLPKISTRYNANSSSVLRNLEALKANETELMLWLEDTIDQQSRELDFAKRHALVRELENKIYYDLALYIPFGQRMAFPGTGPAVKGYRLFDLSLYSNWSIWERVWLDE
jgi:ABC-type transport system substrate-binding protein